MADRARQWRGAGGATVGDGARRDGEMGDRERGREEDRVRRGERDERRARRRQQRGGRVAPPAAWQVAASGRRYRGAASSSWLRNDGGMRAATYWDAPLPFGSANAEQGVRAWPGWAPAPRPRLRVRFFVGLFVREGRRRQSADAGQASMGDGRDKIRWPLSMPSHDQWAAIPPARRASRECKTAVRCARALPTRRVWAVLPQCVVWCAG